MTEEIEKLCSEILPETWEKYLIERGYEISPELETYYSFVFQKEGTKYKVGIPKQLGIFGGGMPEVRISQNEKDRPVLAILLDLWKLQNPNENDLIWLEKHLGANGLQGLYEFFIHLNYSVAQLKDKDKDIRMAYLASNLKFHEDCFLENIAKGKRITELEAENERLKKDVGGIVGMSSGFQDTLKEETEKECLLRGKHIGSDFDDFLDEQRIRDKIEEEVRKRIEKKESSK